MTGFAAVIVFGEGANTTGVVLGALTGAETGGAVAGCFEFTVGHGFGVFCVCCKCVFVVCGGGCFVVRG